MLKQKSGGESPDYAGALATVGQNLLLRKKWAEAEPILRECLAIRATKEPEAWTTFNTHSMLGRVLTGQKKYAEAEPLLLKGYEGMKAREKAIPKERGTHLPEALDRLVELYTATDKPDEEAKWRAKRAKYPSRKEVDPPPREKR
jgi:uncharacterized protein HemY